MPVVYVHYDSPYKTYNSVGVASCHTVDIFGESELDMTRWIPAHPITIRV